MWPLICKKDQTYWFQKCKRETKTFVKKEGKKYPFIEEIISLFLPLDKMYLKGGEYLKYLSGEITRRISTKPE